jgi:transposase
VWNTALGIRSEAYRVCGLRLTGNDLSRWLTQWKHTAGHEWLAEAPATVLARCLRDQDRAFTNFFARRARYPRFKHRSACGSLRFQGVGRSWARGLLSVPIQDAAFSEVRRQLTYKCDWYGRILVELDRWYPSSKRCLECHHTLDVLQLSQRQWTCPKCGTCHDRDINAARNSLAEGRRPLAGRDDRDLRVDARGACPDEIILAQVLAEEARSGQLNRAFPEQVRLS